MMLIWRSMELTPRVLGSSFLTDRYTGITGGSTVDVTFASALDNGTFAVAYGQEPPPTHGKADSFTTPITESGLTHTVPEPGMLLLFGSGLWVLGSLVGKKSENKLIFCGVKGRG